MLQQLCPKEFWCFSALRTNLYGIGFVLYKKESVKVFTSVVASVLRLLGYQQPLGNSQEFQPQQMAKLGSWALVIAFPPSSSCASKTIFTLQQTLFTGIFLPFLFVFFP
ncbi:UNVERIFIED_CONTAM: hypothetical protein K2H54_016161 [Gekko kuhli]